MKLLVIDNYDSFTYNLVQYLGELGASSDVVRNDAIARRGGRAARRRRDRDLARARARRPRPASACDDDPALRGPSMPILGVCLGHQSIGAGLRRPRRARQHAHARQDLADPARRHAISSRACRALRGDALPLARGRARGPAELARRDGRDRRRRDHGRAPPRAPGRRRAVPPRVDPDRAGQGAARELPAPRARSRRGSAA